MTPAERAALRQRAMYLLTKQATRLPRHLLHTLYLAALAIAFTAGAYLA